MADISLSPDDVLPEPEEDPVQVPGDVRAEVPAAVEGVALVHLAGVEHGPYRAGLAGGVEGHLVRNVVAGAPLLLPGLDLSLGGLLGELVGDQVLELLLVDVTPGGVLGQFPLSRPHHTKDSLLVVHKVLTWYFPWIVCPPVWPWV